MNPFEPEPPSAAFGSQLEHATFVRRTRPIWLAPLVILLLLIGGSAWLWAQGKAFPGPQLSLGPLLASPPNFVFNTPTTVTFTIRIDDATPDPNGVKLLRTDAAGNLVQSLGRMNDNGQNGDAVAGDRVFTLTVVVNEPAIGRQYYRVAASFRGNQQIAQSAVAFVDVDPVPLPPDPGEAGKQTLAGIDSDGDGVRDDFQRYVTMRFIDDSAAQGAGKQYGTAMQAALLDTSSGSPIALAEDVLAAHYCFASIVGVRAAYELKADLQEQFLNTSARRSIYDSLQLRLRGAQFGSPQLDELSPFCMN